MLEGNTGHSVTASCDRRPGVGATSHCQPIRATHHVFKTTSETQKFLNQYEIPIMKDSSMPHEPQRRERQTTFWESDGRIVPLKPVQQTGGSKRGNTREGKAAKLTRDSVRPSTAHSGRPSMLARLNRITYRAEREPAATFNNLYSPERPSVRFEMVNQPWPPVDR